MARRIIPKAILDRALRDAHMYGKANLTLNHAQLKWLDEAQDLLLQEYDVSAPASPESGAGGVVSADRAPQVGDKFCIWRDGPFPGASGTILNVHGDENLFAELSDGRRVCLHRSEIYVTRPANATISQGEK